MNTNKQQSDIIGMVANRIVHYLEQDIIPWNMVWGSLPKNLITTRPYRGVNLLLLNPLCYPHSYFLSAEQVRALNASVKEGEKPHLVVFWKRLPYEYEELKSHQPLLGYSFVYNVSQCSGIPAHLIPESQRERYPIAVCDSIILHMKHKPKIRYDENVAYYHPRYDFINVPDIAYFVEEKAFYATLFRQLVHATGHRKRLNRKDLTEPTLFTTHAYSTEELVGEIGACYLQSIAGIFYDTLSDWDAYVEGWIAKIRHDKRCVITASDMAQEAVDYIIGMNTHQDMEHMVELETMAI
jgi:antirestriction protein ArdC